MPRRRDAVALPKDAAEVGQAIEACDSIAISVTVRSGRQPPQAPCGVRSSRLVQMISDTDMLALTEEVLQRPDRRSRWLRRLGPDQQRVAQVLLDQASRP